MHKKEQQYRYFIDGIFFDEAEERQIVYNPATGEPVGTIPFGGRSQAAQAIKAADEACSGWSHLTGKQRGTYLFQIMEAIQERAEQISELITLENGKPIEQARGEVDGTIDHLRWFAEQARRGYGRTVPKQDQGKRHFIIKRPVGVVGAIAPWNFPLVLSVRKIAAALAAGCTTVLKPASTTPLNASILAECVQQADLPRGVFNLVVGQASEIGDEMINNPRCRKITFTGSTPVGRSLMRKASDYIKPLSLELGGNAPLLVFDDADIEQAVEGAIAAKFRNSGQSCIAANRLLVQEGIAEEFTDAFVSATKQLTVGPGINPGMDIGALINQDALDGALAYIDGALQKGATLACGGSRITKNDMDKGFFIAPAVLTNVSDDMECMNEEIFAPVAPIATFKSFGEAIKRANATQYGLSAYAFTSNLSRALRLGEELEAGTIGINDGVPSTSNCPFGGVKQSGMGRELGIEGMDAFLETKHLSVGIEELT